MEYDVELHYQGELMEQKIIPYSSNPTDDQEKISWIVNSEHLNGIDRNGDTGTLNRSGMQLLENIETLDSNIKKIVEFIDGLDKSVDEQKRLFDALSGGDTLALLQSTSLALEEIHQNDIKTNELYETVHQKFYALLSVVGERNPEDSSQRTIFDDIAFIKSVLGNKTNEDYNGNISSSSSSGFFKKIDDVSTHVVELERLIGELTAKVQRAQTEYLEQSFNELREELGNQSGKTETTIYFRLASTEQDIKTINTELDEINQKIGSPEVIKDKVKENTNEIISLKSKSSELLTSVEELQQNISAPDTGVKARLSTVENLVKLNQDAVANIRQTLEVTNQTAIDAKTLGLSNQEMQRSMSLTLSELQLELGTDSSGLKGEIAQTKEGLEANSSKLKTVEKSLGDLKTAGVLTNADLAREVSKIKGESNLIHTIKKGWSASVQNIEQVSPTMQIGYCYLFPGEFVSNVDGTLVFLNGLEITGHTRVTAGSRIEVPNNTSSGKLTCASDVNPMIVHGTSLPKFSTYKRVSREDVLRLFEENSAAYDKKILCIHDSQELPLAFDSIEVKKSKVNNILNYVMPDQNYAVVLVQLGYDSWVNNNNIDDFESALERILNNIYSSTDAKVLIITPWKQLSSQGKSFNYPEPNINMVKLEQFVEVIKKVSKKYSTQVLDLFDICGINTANLNKYTRGGILAESKQFELSNRVRSEMLFTGV